MNLLCQEISTLDEIESARAVRHRVFVEEQGVPLHCEQDGLDETARHFAGYADGVMAAVCRLRIVDDAAKIERVATLKEKRGQGHARLLMKYVMGVAAQMHGVKRLKLSAQLPVVSFYEALGFQRYGDTYMDAGILHVDMMQNVK